ncbi:DUF916 and DUF3324 domain-containing protein [Lacticaseibacillus suihuaensis]
MKRLASFLFLLAAAVLLWPVATAKAATFAVAPVFPSNQIDRASGYLDLRVTPGSEQTLHIKVQNQTAASHRYQVAVNRAATSATGVIDYTRHDLPAAKSLAVNIETLLPAVHTVTVAPHKVATVALRLTVPQTPFTGILLGGIRVQQADGADAGQVAYVIGLQLRQTKSLPAAKLRLNQVAATASGSGVTVAAKLENTAATIVNDLSVKAAVTRVGATKVVLHRQASGLRMAPNSVFAFPVVLTPTTLAAGRYEAAITAKAGAKTWHFTRQFSVKAAVTQAATSSTQPATHRGIPLAPWLVAGLIIVLAGLALGVFYLLSNR